MLLDFTKGFDALIYQLQLLNIAFDSAEADERRERHQRESRGRQDRAAAFRNLETMMRQGAASERRAVARKAAPMRPQQAPAPGPSFGPRPSGYRR
ncbi:hypothetical protein [Burkholderia ubonensis]|uniref:hypothetical protein n=1 Tax=Burkholderia ubonensis TaxID=101571 RepID=UPI000A9B8DAC|nr:hypothetical protein [Burkholderia ubonensis]